MKKIGAIIGLLCLLGLCPEPRQVYKPEGWIASVNLRGICKFGTLENNKELSGEFRAGPGVMVVEGYYNVGLKYTVASWLTPGNSFLACEYEMVQNEGTVVGHLVVIDTTGKVIERIVDNKKGIIVDHSYPSKIIVRFYIHTILIIQKLTPAMNKSMKHLILSCHSLFWI